MEKYDTFIEVKAQYPIGHIISTANVTYEVVGSAMPTNPNDEAIIYLKEI